MTAACQICGRVWDARDPGVTYHYDSGTWECHDEDECFGRLALARMDEEARLLAAPESGA